MTIGGKTIPSIFMTGGLPPGVIEIGVTIPDGVQTGSAVPVTIQAGNASSQAGVTIAVQQT